VPSTRGLDIACVPPARRQFNDGGEGRWRERGGVIGADERWINACVAAIAGADGCVACGPSGSTGFTFICGEPCGCPAVVGRWPRPRARLSAIGF